MRSRAAIIARRRMNQATLLAGMAVLLIAGGGCRRDDADSPGPPTVTDAEPPRLHVDDLPVGDPEHIRELLREHVVEASAGPPRHPELQVGPIRCSLNEGTAWIGHAIRQVALSAADLAGVVDQLLQTSDRWPAERCIAPQVLVIGIATALDKGYCGLAGTWLHALGDVDMPCEALSSLFSRSACKFAEAGRPKEVEICLRQMMAPDSRREWIRENVGSDVVLDQGLWSYLVVNAVGFEDLFDLLMSRGVDREADGIRGGPNERELLRLAHIREPKYVIRSDRRCRGGASRTTS